MNAPPTNRLDPRRPRRGPANWMRLFRVLEFGQFESSAAFCQAAERNHFDPDGLVSGGCGFQPQPMRIAHD